MLKSVAKDAAGEVVNICFHGHLISGNQWLLLDVASGFQCRVQQADLV